MKISVPPYVERAFTGRANALGITPEILAVDSLRGRSFSEPDMDDAPVGESNAKTLADFIEGHVGVVHSSEKVSGAARICDHTRTSFGGGLTQPRAARRL